KAQSRSRMNVARELGYAHVAHRAGEVVSPHKGHSFSPKKPTVSQHAAVTQHQCETKIVPHGGGESTAPRKQTHRPRVVAAHGRIHLHEAALRVSASQRGWRGRASGIGFVFGEC